MQYTRIDEANWYKIETGTEFQCGETGFHCLAAARVADRYPREAFASGLRILGEGQLSLTKFLIVTDGDIDVSDFKTLWVHVLERVDWQSDLFVFANIRSPKAGIPFMDPAQNGMPR